jgi:hypothetical protein
VDKPVPPPMATTLSAEGVRELVVIDRAPSYDGMAAPSG